MNIPLVYQPGEHRNSKFPLARFLPRLPEGAAAAWLKQNVEPGSWVIDPFGASPHLAVEAAQAGYKILVIANNPITRFLIEMVATPPAKENLIPVLADLAASKRGSDRIEPHILDLYKTECDNCGNQIVAEAFLWEKDSDFPYAKIYTCPYCQQGGENPANASDIERAKHFGQSGPHRARALERVASHNSPNREHVEEALDAYLPRSIYALFTLINKIDGLNLSNQDRDHLIAILLSACDRGNTLWQVSGGRSRPKQLTTPSRFYEYNIWFGMEQSIDLWTSERPATALTYWPNLPPDSGGIALYEGRMSDFEDNYKDFLFDAVISAFPRPNQAFWTLSALWAGWLWGQDAIGPIASVLKRRRFDWAWHTTALHNNLSNLSPFLSDKTPFFGLVTESESAFDTSVIVAAEFASFELKNMAMRRKSAQTQIEWQYTKSPVSPQKTDRANLIKSVSKESLKEYGQPTHFRRLSNAALVHLAKNHAITIIGKNPAESFSEIRTLIEEQLAYHPELTRYKKSEHSIEVGRWWLSNPTDSSEPLADRVEKAVVNHLVSHSPVSLREMDPIICQQFPGLMTPELEWIENILSSYAELDESGKWDLRPEDQPQKRREDINEIKNTLNDLGNNFGFAVTPSDKGLIWKGQISFNLYISASAVLGKILNTKLSPNTHNLLFLPGSRADLVMKKLDNDPRLKEIIDEHWSILKFRWVRRLKDTPGLNFETFQSQITLDPIQEGDPQLPLL